MISDKNKIKDISILAIIPARGGSKGIKNKNIAPLCGKPLIEWTIEAALASSFISSVYVSTDSPAIADIARDAGAMVPFLRPSSLAQDSTPTIDVVLDFIERYSGKVETVVLLQPTSPLRTTQDIDLSIELFQKKFCHSLVSVTSVKELPHHMYTLQNERLQSLIRKRITQRQMVDNLFLVNGAIYINDISYLKKYRKFVFENSVPYVMPKRRSIDIDDELDWIIAELILSSLRNE